MEAHVTAEYCSVLWVVDANATDEYCSALWVVNVHTTEEYCSISLGGGCSCYRQMALFISAGHMTLAF